ncbi:FAD/NAD(P)-binding domain-containing protein [Epithele typhae]|uniref:FAD/NAD(P)-binding domain-containing protein n=1 Tax=Epithele typhae TaxID=378194 RepID=UPI0020073D3E|nr:FAD/NAD(P)-binding domain-containing protein [Epithele typhae]KAH9914155.1 FAD/NAD(P)-binding domain-containing protein [Epithele typhae]
MRSATIFLATTAAYAFQLPFNLPFFSSASQTPLVAPPQEVHDAAVPNRIAIIGAGAAGSSAAFWISKAKERYGVDVEVDVYDKNAWVGGRDTTVQPYDDESAMPHELGASIFVKINKNIWRAVDEFGLERVNFEDEDDVMGLWNGQEFVLSTGGGGFLNGWMDKIKILWRYGYHAPTKTQELVGAMADKFARLYKPNTPHWTNISSVSDTLEFSPLVAQTTAEYLDLQGVNKLWSRELVEAATRVNYGQDVDKIHALEGMCSLAAYSASSVKGGNWQVFDHFLKHSKANLFRETTVKSVLRTSSGWLVHSTLSDVPRAYRTVVLAAPYHQTGISFSAEPSLAHVPWQPYVHLHVTLLSTSSPAPNPAYFNLRPGSKTPSTILTTYDGVRHGGPEPEFNSVSYHGPLMMKNGERRVNAQGEQEWTVKVFSKKRVDDKWLKEMFEGKVGWVYRHEFDAYPVLPPTTTFPPVKLAEGLYYVNAFEPLISTMETETIAARNVVELLMKEQFDAGLCKAEDVEKSMADGKLDDDDYVYGWDC